MKKLRAIVLVCIGFMTAVSSGQADLKVGLQWIYNVSVSLTFDLSPG